MQLTAFQSRNAIWLLLLGVIAPVLKVHAQHYSATYLPSNAPPKSEQGQTGTNQCGTDSSQGSMCQNAYINSVEDFCLFAPPSPGADSTIGDTERFEVSWCTQSGHGTRVIPNGAITGAHFVQTPDYVQITGVGDLTLLNIPKGDEGGELDPHGADGNGNPIGGLVFGSSFGKLQQYHEWTNFMGDSMFCFRACKDGSGAPALCQHIYDVMGCEWNMPGNYDAGSFEDCLGDTGEPMGVYGTSTFFQGEPNTPAAHPAPATSQCTQVKSIGGIILPSTTSSSSISTSSGSLSGTPSASTTLTSKVESSTSDSASLAALSAKQSSSISASVPSTSGTAASRSTASSVASVTSTSPQATTTSSSAVRAVDVNLFWAPIGVAGLLVALTL